MEMKGWFNNTLCLFKKYFKRKDRDGKWAKNPFILVFNYRSQGGPDPEMLLMVKFTRSFIPSLIHSKCQYNQQCHSDLSPDKGWACWKSSMSWRDGLRSTELTANLRMLHSSIKWDPAICTLGLHSSGCAQRCQQLHIMFLAFTGGTKYWPEEHCCTFTVKQRTLLHLFW